MTDWTVETLKEYFDALRVSDLEAIRKAESALTLRLEAMNEFRSQLQSERGTYITREFADAQLAIRQEQFEGMLSRFEKMEKSQARLAGGLFLAGFMAPLISGLIVGLVVYLLTRHGIPTG